MALAPGTRLGPYEIHSTIGHGGMGEVYLAHDTRLRRNVAVKVLHPDAQASDSAKRRFGKEAQTASALNHPNIVSIFDVGHSDGLDYIAMEYVEGRTLRAMLASGAIEFRRAIDIAAQAAAGLAAAHDAGVVHRDIKPENLMVGADGHVKVLDFGIAKPAERPVATDVMTALTETAALTQTGAIIGTAAYMSPEQAKGEAVDRRTDIFSLGVVLYESLTGQRPFTGPTTIDVLHALINVEPRSVVELNSRLPLEIAEVLDKALAKEPSSRYHDAGDLALDLRRLKRAVENGSLSSLAAGRTPSGERKYKWFAATAATIALASVVLWTIPRPVQPSTVSGTASSVTLTQLTTDEGFEGDPSFSPDGETLAYASDRLGNFDIFLKQVSGGADINITNDPADDVQPSFSPDGRQIAFVSTRGGASPLHYVGPEIPLRGGDIWVMPALGGNARRVAVGGNFPSWSPDGTELLYTSGPWFGQKIFRVSAMGGQAREVPLQFSPGITPNHLLYPRFSTDRRWIAFSSSTEVYVVGEDGGAVIPVARGQAPTWGTDSNSIIYSSGDAGTNQSLWQIGFDRAGGKPSGDSRPITVGRGRDLTPTSSGNGRRIAFAGTTITTGLESRDFDAEMGRFRGAAVQLTNTSDFINFFDLSPDGRLALLALRRGSTNSIWRVDATRALVQLAADPQYDDENPLWSPDGKTIAFSRRPTSSLQSGYSLWTMTADGADPQRRVEKMGLNGLFTWMPDGRGIVHVGPGRQLYLLDLASGSERPLTNEPGVMPIVAISPDGNWIIYQCVVGATVDLHAVPTAGGEARTVVDSPFQDYHPTLSASGRWVYYLPDHRNLYRVPGPAQNWRTATPEQVTNLPLTPVSFIENPQISRDGRTLAYSRGRITSDIWLASIER